MKKSKKLYTMIALMLLCITVNILGVSQTMAWFVSGGLLGTGGYSTAKVQYLPTLEPNNVQKGKYGSLIRGTTDDNIVFLIPGESIIEEFEEKDGYLTLENFSTVPSEVRTVIECNFINNTENPDGTTTDSLDSMTGFGWRSMGGDVYQYGKKNTIKDGTEIFMGLLEVTFSNKKVKETTYPGYIAPTGDSDDETTAYSWKYVSNTDTYDATKIDFSNAWDLVLDGQTVIPAPKTEDETKGRAYNVITDIKIVGENNGYQGDFDKYFSENYAGRRVRISVKYYAKQTMGMEWNLFSEELLEM